jgi:hypothetical protein
MTNTSSWRIPSCMHKSCSDAMCNVAHSAVQPVKPQQWALGGRRPHHLDGRHRSHHLQRPPLCCARYDCPRACNLICIHSVSALAVCLLLYVPATIQCLGHGRRLYLEDIGVVFDMDPDMHTISKI